MGEQQFNSLWIVPYNPYLLLKYRCHINVEACATLKSVKHLHKYFFKHADAALLRVVEQHANANSENNNDTTAHLNYNEIEHYLNTRYMSPMEAAWHLNRFEMHNSSHTVYRLPVHLPLEQVVVFHPGAEQQAAERNEVTMLTGWFELNQHDPTARQYLYAEIPIHFVWQTSERKEWTPRRRCCDKTVSRLYSVSVRYRELFYLRTLLLHVRGATSFEFIRTVREQIYTTFGEACRLRGLLAEDAEWHRCLAEAVQRQMPKKLRQLFAYITTMLTTKTRMLF